MLNRMYSMQRTKILKLHGGRETKKNCIKIVDPAYVECFCQIRRLSYAFRNLLKGLGLFTNEEKDITYYLGIKKTDLTKDVDRKTYEAKIEKPRLKIFFSKL